jgi:hypothetical protein
MQKDFYKARKHKIWNTELTTDTLGAVEINVTPHQMYSFSLVTTKTRN